MYALRYAVGLFILLNLAGCCWLNPYGFRTIKTPEGEFACPCCEPMIKYSGTTLTIKTAKFGKVDIGEVTVGPTMIQQASEIAQVLDLNRISSCQMLPTYATISKAKFSEAADRIQKLQEMLMQLAVIGTMKDSATLEAYIKVYGPQALSLKAGMETSQTKGISTKALAEFEPSEGIRVVPLKELLK